MAANDADFNDCLSGKSQTDEDRRRVGPEITKTSRNSKHSRSRSRSGDRKRKSGVKRHRRSRSRSKEARKKDSEKALKCRSGLEEQLDSSDKGRDRLSEGMEEGHRRKERKSIRTRSISRSRSRERRHHSRNRDKRRSRSRSGDRRSRSHEKKRRARSRSNSIKRSKHRHCSKSRSKSREKKKRMDKVKKKSRSGSVSPVTFRGRNTAMDAQEALARRLERAKKLQEQKEKDLLEKQQQDKAAAAPLMCDTVTAAASPALNVAALLASGTQVTPQFAMAAQMAALQAKTLAETGIAVPGYYNPSAVNPMKFAEQEKKRKMLWQGKKEGDKSQTAELWEKLNFGNKDQNVKFRKLMGIKGEEEGSSSGAVNEEGLRTLQHQEEMFRNLDVQYEMARSQTHTQRGMGLGFSSSFSSRGMDAI
ncbi:arginine/serine-rich coiled-coil protein 2 isoform X2 [Xyrauchen texanus]|uniref:arginine/serine-rich coiled-coil protein 2 isoform X2 n=1 Tax=Xyrauchen texanus TaxID=154827 RepID=UPI002241A7AB|nr:arginine/serine-rich coiled-coil protein 2 isoform X2 [Xyrauchen texanus]